MRALEEHSRTAWPALRTLAVDGWLLGFSGGYTKRANSVNALAPTAAALSIVPVAETLYARHGQRAIFRITGLAPPDTDAALADAGYERFDPSLALAAPACAGRCDPAVRLEAAPSLDWLDGFARLAGLSEPARALHRALLSRIVLPAAYATLRDDGGRVVGVGMAVCGGRLVGLFDIAVAPEMQRNGFGRSIASRLIGWGSLRGAGTAYLQVVERNLGARRLYERLGFSQTYRYHYRQRPLSPEAGAAHSRRIG